MVVLILLLLMLAIAVGLVLGNPNWRRHYLTTRIYRAFRRVMPPVSASEQAALDAGSVWWEGTLFRGRPDWGRLHNMGRPTLSGEEQAFLDQDVAALCEQVDDWEITTRRFDLPPEAWDTIKSRGFLGLIIPPEYGGKGFSALAHSEVVRKLSTRSSALAVTVMVPNSLGPAELLLAYGTEAQKQHYLPRLARGEEIPAFALTSPWAGSDAGAIPDFGIVCKGVWQGQEVLGMRVTWDKRYITLAPACTLLGLAFRLFDPDRLLGGEEDIGITCALVPADHPGVEIGRRHLPLDAMFLNGPTRGTDVFMPLDFIIGGAAMAGQGWRMLMDSLAAGRSISLPASFCGMAALTARTVGAYCAIRQQFGSPIARFEGVQEVLARIAGNLYAMDAARALTAHAVDLGEKPSVLSAIVKYHLTERGRAVVNDGMDLIGGKGICLGPSNFLARAYQQLPIGITVEGANILTRSLMIFGQGAIRCHPYLLAEMEAARDPDPQRGLAAFDALFWAHARHTSANALRALGHALTGARLARVQVSVAPAMWPHYRRLARYSAAFAVVADGALLSLGGSLKFREALSGRLGDMLSQLYIASAVLKRYEDQGRQPQDADLVHWAVQDALHKAEQALDGVLKNLPNRAVAVALRLITLPLGRWSAPPSDALNQRVAKLLTRPGPGRDRLVPNCHLPLSPEDPISTLEAALHATVAAEAADRKLHKFAKSGKLEGNPVANVRDMADAVHAAGGVTPEEYELLTRRNALRDQVIAVDDFPRDLSTPEARGAAQRHPA
ncbi:MAG TPA: acyl-CoA dehydrogenase [Burkholderiaceae bacterium]|nr:acyl-CoA dehydrogenase [Burkholderiaceae bacterium]